MKITAQEEYGLRIMVRVARAKEGISIADVSELEGISHHNVAKLCRILRMNGYLESQKGHQGGYVLSKSADDINLKDLLHDLGGSLYDESFCDRFSDGVQLCTNSVDCSVRSVWKVLQAGVDDTLKKIKLSHLVGTEEKIKETICSPMVLNKKVNL